MIMAMCIVCGRVKGKKSCGDSGKVCGNCCILRQKAGYACTEGCTSRREKKAESIEKSVNWTYMIETAAKRVRQDHGLALEVEPSESLYRYMLTLENAVIQAHRGRGLNDNVVLEAYRILLCRAAAKLAESEFPPDAGSELARQLADRLEEALIDELCALTDLQELEALCFLERSVTRSTKDRGSMGYLGFIQKNRPKMLSPWGDEDDGEDDEDEDEDEDDDLAGDALDVDDDDFFGTDVEYTPMYEQGYLDTLPPDHPHNRFQQLQDEAFDLIANEEYPEAEQTFFRLRRGLEKAGEHHFVENVLLDLITLYEHAEPDWDCEHKIIEVLQELIQIGSPDDILGYELDLAERVMCYSSLAEGQAMFEKLRQVHPDLLKVPYRQASALDDAGQEEEARIILEGLLEEEAHWEDEDYLAEVRLLLQYIEV